MPLLRRVIGSVLRRIRLRQGRTLQDVARAADVSLPYLSEIERGRKEASSEVLAAICRALGVALADLLDEARKELVRSQPRVHPRLAHRAVDCPAGDRRPETTAATSRAWGHPPAWGYSRTSGYRCRRGITTSGLLRSAQPGTFLRAGGKTILLAGEK